MARDEAEGGLQKTESPPARPASPTDTPFDARLLEALRQIGSPPSHPTHPPDPALYRGLRWEVCEIVLERVEHHLWVGGYHVRFAALAVGPQGPYRADASAPLYVADIAALAENDEATAAVQALVQRLTDAGWTRGSHGSHWYSFRFRRVPHQGGRSASVAP